jgi:hypothetical protein
MCVVPISLPDADLDTSLLLPRTPCSARGDKYDVQTTLIRVLSVFRLVVTTTLEVQAHAFPTHVHLCHRVQHTIKMLRKLSR